MQESQEGPRAKDQEPLFSSLNIQTSHPTVAMPVLASYLFPGAADRQVSTSHNTHEHMSILFLHHQWEQIGRVLNCSFLAKLSIWMSALPFPPFRLNNNQVVVTVSLPLAEVQNFYSWVLWHWCLWWDVLCLNLLHKDNPICNTSCIHVQNLGFILY